MIAADSTHRSLCRSRCGLIGFLMQQCGSFCDIVFVGSFCDIVRVVALGVLANSVSDKDVDGIFFFFLNKIYTVKNLKSFFLSFNLFCFLIIPVQINV